MSDESIYEWSRFKRFLVFAFVCSLGIGGIALLFKSLLVAISISLILCYVLSPAILKIESHSSIKRHWIVLFVSILFFGGFVIVGASILPTIYNEIIEIAKQVPRSIVYLNQKIIPVRDWLVEIGVFSYASFDNMILNLDLMQNITSTTTNAIQKVWDSTPKLLGGAINAFLIPLLTWFLLNYLEPIKNFVKSILPSDIHEMSLHNIRKMDGILWGVVKGQLIVASILSFLYMLGFSLISLQSGVAIGAVAGLCRIVPYLDVLVGGALSIIVIIGKGGDLTMILAVVAVIAVVQGMDGAFITPRIIGERAGIHPVIVILSVVAFGDWFGIMGIILAVPTVAIIASAVQMGLPYYHKSPFFRGDH